MMPIALQLYSVREQVAEDLPGTLKAVADMGYDGVELFAKFQGGPAEQVRKMLNDVGLRCISNHPPRGNLFGDDLPAAIDYHLAINCPHLIVPSLPADWRNTPDACRQTAERMSQLDERLAQHNLRAGYHNHYHDMAPLEGGESAWDMIARNTPDSFILQYDTANGVQGGADPVAPLRAYPGRGETVHLKEYVGSDSEGHGKAVLGEGDVPWSDVFDACEKTAGTKWYIVEQEGHPTLSPIEAARQSLRNLRAMLAKR